MSRNTRTLVVMAVALVAAGAASLGAYRAIQRIPVREVPVAHQFAVVAAKPMPAGALLKKEDVKLVAWPSSDLMPGGFTKVEDVVERGLTDSVAENEPIVANKLADRGAGAGLPPTIPQGMRAISVKVNEVIGVAGFAVPGSRVDVLVTVRNNGSSPRSRVVVGNVQVLTSGTNYDRLEAKSDAKPIPATVVTLAVTPGDAERIALAGSEGQIILALRNPLDHHASETEGVGMDSLLGAAAPARLPAVKRQPSVTPVPVTAAAPTVYTVETIRAAKRAEEQVR